MAERLEVYECKVCGNIVEVLRGGVGDLVCCGQPMVCLEAHRLDEGKEKHVPVIERVKDGARVKVGSTPHPMEEKHYIEWIEVIANGKAYREFLQPGKTPEATFQLGAETLIAREFCNVHGLWRGG